MKRYICENVFVPLRSGPSHKSEMLSQVLFGERYKILDQVDHWMKIETEFDSYSGWIDINHLQHSEDEDTIKGHTLNRSLTCYRENNSRLNLEAGCEIYNPDFKNSTFTVGNHRFTAGGEFNSTIIKAEGTVANTAMKFINSPYIWGGRIPSGIDCSGFTQLVYKIHGTAIPRDSWQQAETGESITFIDETLSGDLVFFDNERGRIAHVGMILSKGLVIHASGRVRIDSIDHQGIFKQEAGTYSHHLRMIRRISRE